MGVVRQSLKRLVPARVREEIHLTRSFLRPIVQPRVPPIRYVIFGQGRSGSTLLTSLLGCHPEVYADGEILNVSHHRRFFSPLWRIRTRSHIARDERAYGFHLKIYQLTLDYGWSVPRAREFLHGLASDGWRVIYLRRDNVLRQAISANVAVRRGFHFASGDSKRASGPAPVIVERVMKWIPARLRYLEEEATVLEGLDVLEVRYESDLFDPDAHQATADRVFAFLGLDSAPVTAGLARIGRRRLEEQIANYDELAEAVRAAGYERFLDPPASEG